MGSNGRFSLRFVERSVRHAWRTLGHALGLAASADRTRGRQRFARLQRLEDRNLLSVTPMAAGITVRPPFDLGPEFRVNTTTAGAQQTASESPRAMAMDGLGNFVVVWS